MNPVSSWQYSNKFPSSSVMQCEHYCTVSCFRSNTLTHAGWVTHTRKYSTSHIYYIVVSPAFIPLMNLSCNCTPTLERSFHGVLKPSKAKPSPLLNQLLRMKFTSLHRTPNFQPYIHPCFPSRPLLIFTYVRRCCGEPMVKAIPLCKINA